MSLSESMVSLIRKNYTFCWNTSSIKYLGINLTSKFEDLYKANYPPMYKKLESDLDEWSSHNIGWMGRISSIKMTLLPRILYLFHSLPIPIKTNHLKTFQSKLTKFVWNKNNTRVSSRSLFNLPEQGGFGLPNLLWYYKAARLAQLSGPIHTRGFIRRYGPADRIRG